MCVERAVEKLAPLGSVETVLASAMQTVQPVNLRRVMAARERIRNAMLACEVVGHLATARMPTEMPMQNDALPGLDRWEALTGWAAESLLADHHRGDSRHDRRHGCHCEELQTLRVVTDATDPRAPRRRLRQCGPFGATR